jgi:IS5 family transposase
MLGVYCLPLWFDQSNTALEEALYDSRAMRGFVAIEPGREPMPDESSAMRRSSA